MSGPREHEVEEARAQVREEIRNLIKELPENSRATVEESVAKFLKGLRKADKDQKPMLRYFEAVEAAHEERGSDGSAWHDLEVGLSQAVEHDREGRTWQVCSKIREVLLDEPIKIATAFYKDHSSAILERWKSIADGEKAEKPLDQRIHALRKIHRAHELLEVLERGQGKVAGPQWSPEEGRAEERETIYRLYIDCTALFTVIKGHLEEGKKLEKMNWRFSMTGDVQTPVISEFLKEEKFSEDDIRSETQKVVDAFVARKKSLSPRTIRDRYKEGRNRQVERIKAELNEKYGQYMELKEIEKKAAADEEELRSNAIARRIRAILHASEKHG